MKKTSRERNSAGMFSDYGLDERQKLIMASIGLKGFKLMVYAIGAITVILLSLYYSGIIIPMQYTVLIYYAVMIVGWAAFMITASRYGVLNQVYSFSSTTGAVVIAVIMIAVFTVFSIHCIVNEKAFDSDPVVGLAICGLTAILQFIRYYCGKRNFNVLDEQSQETDDVS